MSSCNYWVYSRDALRGNTRDQQGKLVDERNDIRYSRHLYNGSGFVKKIEKQSDEIRYWPKKVWL